MTMTPDAKRALSSTIRALRDRLLADLHASTESAYRLSVRARDAGLDEQARVRRGRLEAWLDEQVRTQAGKKGKKVRTAEEFRLEVEKQAAYTWLNRVVILRLMEAADLRTPAVVTGAWESRAYRDFRQLAPALVRGDETEGYAHLLTLVFEDLATDLPGIFGPAGVAELVPLPPATLRHLVEALDADDLSNCWTDDMTLGWVYQYWNDPEREALDAKLNSGGKVEPHEIASKTQMFTERYMVDWLLQNSLGPMWLAMCKKHGWTPEVEADGTLEWLEARRVDWRGKRDREEVSLTELMPLETDAERRWAYYVPQPIPDDAVEHAPETVRNLKVLDPALGSGHFLVVAFDLLVALYREEARHRGEEGQEQWSERRIVERILEHNLHGIDLDPRAVQIAAAALWLKAQQTCAEARPRTLNLVASDLRLGALPQDDPALEELRSEVERETGIPGRLTDTVVQALAGADHLGSLLKVDKAVEEALEAHEGELSRKGADQGDLFGGFPAEQMRMPLAPEAARQSVLARLERFLGRRTGGDDLGLRLRGEQLAAGVRFVRLVREGGYDLVVGNPPYQGTTKLVDAEYVRKHYARGKADLYAAFLERGLQFACKGGTSALLTMRNWMFIKQYSVLRQWMLKTYDLWTLGDLGSGAFAEISPAQVVVSVVMSIFRSTRPAQSATFAHRYFNDATVLQVGETDRKRATVLCGEGRYEFGPDALKAVPEVPLVYWWGEQLVREYSLTDKVKTRAPLRKGLITSNDPRFTRRPWEIHQGLIGGDSRCLFSPLVKGAAGRKWFEPVLDIVRWHLNGLEVKLYNANASGGRIVGEDKYFHIGIAFPKIAEDFSGRLHCTRSIAGDAGPSIFPESDADIPGVLCAMNSKKVRYVLNSLNPTLNFQLDDVLRLPLFSVLSAEEIVRTIKIEFNLGEAAREPSLEFCCPGPSSWRYAQVWAQAAVDRPDGTPLSPYEPAYDPEPPTDHISYALGIALGRFHPNGEGIIDPYEDDPSASLPAGICFLDGTLGREDLHDSLGHPVARSLQDTWSERGVDIDAKTDLRSYLRLKFFGDVHRTMYENRPIHWPLSSKKKTFVAWVNIHRFNADTLRVLLADHLHPALARLDGEIDDLRATRDGADKKASRAAEKRFASVKKWREELRTFIEDVTHCAEKGPPPTDGKCPPRAVDARYDPDVDDGVMINSAGLWPLLLPQWKDPKKWWKELASAKGRKDYDWSHLAMRYWPDRVDAKCQEDPSLGVAHGCFWKYHPGRAWAWELRLQDEIGPDFRIEEAPYRDDGGDAAHRAAYLDQHPEEALQAVEKEVLRRKRKQKETQAELTLLEAGLWSAVPELCWNLELRIMEKQKSEFHLRAPDEPDARVALTAAQPRLEKVRESLLLKVQPKRKLFDDDARN